MMTRKEFETELTKRLEDIRALYMKYNPDEFNSGDAHLSCWVDADSINAFNTDKNRPVEIYLRI